MGTDHLVVVYYAADFDEAHRRWTRGEAPLYRTHPESLEMARTTAAQGWRVTLVSALGEPTPRSELEPGVGFERLGLVPHDDAPGIVAALDALDPTALVLHFADPTLLEWADSQAGRFRTAAVNATSFHGRGVRFRLRTRRVVQALNRPGIEVIGNHGVPATENFRRHGVDPRRLVAYDFRHTIGPSQHEVRSIRPGAAEQPRLFYVGYISEEKGVRDVIEATTHHSWGTQRPSARIAGGGELDQAAAWIRSAGAQDRVELLGPVDNATVQAEMREADLVVVPSRPSFPEGFPLTMFEAIASRTPVVASDHPIFEAMLRPGVDVETFEAGNPGALAAAVRRVLEPERYRERSEHADQAWERLQVPLGWTALIDHFRQGAVQEIIGEHALVGARR